jgi:multidrug efflux pump subunit AcrA (membrane-fusion protein)
MGLWYWINDNHEVLQTVGSWVAAAIALAGVIAAFSYVRLTRRLAEQAKAAGESARVQADAALKQAEASLQGAQASRKGAEAAAEQANITRQIFEAAHRPYLQIEMDRESSFFEDPDFFRLLFTLKNHGPVPAILAERQVTVKEEGQLVAERRPAPTDSNRALFAGEEEIAFRFERMRPGSSTRDRQRPGIEVDCTVGYRAPNNIPYVTRVVARSTETGQWQYTAFEV